MDNLPVHYAEIAKTLIESVGTKIKFLSPYSPDLSPIELCWSKLKEIIRRQLTCPVATINGSSKLLVKVEDAPGERFHHRSDSRKEIML